MSFRSFENKNWTFGGSFDNFLGIFIYYFLRESFYFRLKNTKRSSKNAK